MYSTYTGYIIVMKKYSWVESPVAAAAAAAVGSPKSSKAVGWARFFLRSPSRSLNELLRRWNRAATSGSASRWSRWNISLSWSSIPARGAADGASAPTSPAAGDESEAETGEFISSTTRATVFKQINLMYSTSITRK